MYVLTQFNSLSLNRHLTRTYNTGSGVRTGGEGFVEVLAATQTPTESDWFAGSADAVRQYTWLLADIKNRSIEDILILSGDHLYRMNYLKFVTYHREMNADITVAALPCSLKRTKDYGVMKIDGDSRIVDFAEKPSTEEELSRMRTDTTVFGLTPSEAEEKPYIASMGIYVFKKEVLIGLLNDKFPNAVEFGSQVIPLAAKCMNVVAYPFFGYWKDIGTLKSFFDENLKLCRQPADFEFYDPQSPIFTSPIILPPAAIGEGCQVSDAIISPGARLGRATISNAVLGVRAIVSDDCLIQDAMIMGADYFESEEQLLEGMIKNEIPIGIGAGTVIENAIIDKNARIGKNCQIINVHGVDSASYDDKGIYIRDGIVIVQPSASVPDGTII
eukprot:360679-Chlamydomonas_euryale.AAC.7